MSICFCTSKRWRISSDVKSKWGNALSNVSFLRRCVFLSGNHGPFKFYWIYAIDILIQYIFLKYLYYIYVYIHNIFGYGPTTHYLKGENVGPFEAQVFLVTQSFVFLCQIWILIMLQCCAKGSQFARQIDLWISLDISWLSDVCQFCVKIFWKRVPAGNFESDVDGRECDRLQCEATRFCHTSLVLRNWMQS